MIISQDLRRTQSITSISKLKAKKAIISYSALYWCSLQRTRTKERSLLLHPAIWARRRMERITYISLKENKNPWYLTRFNGLWSLSQCLVHVSGKYHGFLIWRSLLFFINYYIYKFLIIPILKILTKVLINFWEFLNGPHRLNLKFIYVIICKE